MNFQIILLLALPFYVLSRDYDDDESRPYEFGFTIDGQQHRHEAKDINGIIMGEFGFITADGVYHVTVYATDENGSFKILSMRNIKISEPLDTPGYMFPSKVQQNLGTFELDPDPPLVSQTILPQIQTTSAPNFPYIFTTIPSLNVASCGSCKLPKTTPKLPGAPNGLFFQTPAFQRPPNNGNIPIPNDPNRVAPDEGFVKPSVEQSASPQLSKPDVQTNANTVQQPVNPFTSFVPDVDNQKAPVVLSNDNPIRQPSPDLLQPPIYPISPPVRDVHNDNFPVNPGLNSRVTVSNNQINIPGKKPIPITDPYPNMVDGLPAGITQDDMLELLYKFNYTLGFHGHHEKGLRNGAKIGAYFVNGRDGISRVVEYIADENGYRPKVKFINLGLDSEKTPKEGTEKKFGLRGFEFVWYPV